MSFPLKPVVHGMVIAFGSLAMVAGTDALAQQAAPSAEEQKLDEVVVTGTRIRAPGVVSSSPIATVTGEELRSTLPVAVEEVIKNLPVAVPAIGPGTNNGSGGGATIDLRGLGSNRSLVLINGRRLVPFNLDGSVDTNSIPIALLERVDLVTGGASAVYGADAVSGVANFVTRRNFSGVDATVAFGQSDRGDTQRWRADATLGASLADGRGNVVMSIGRTSTDPLTQGQRPLGQFSLSSTSGAVQGSGTDVPAQFLGLPGGLGTRQINPTTGQLVTPGPGYNFGPENYYVTPLERQQFTALANFTVNDYFEPYAELFYSRSDVTQNLAATGTFFNSYTVPIGNPFIPAAARQQLCTAFGISAADCVVGNATPVALTIGRRLVELGPRIGKFENKFSQYTLGTKGALFGSWSYDAYFAKGEADQTRQLINWGSLSRVRQALDAVSTTACRNTAGGCVPLNVFGPAGSITPQMLAFINLDSVQLQNVSQQVLAASASGDLGSLRSPMAKSPLSMAVGAESRRLYAANKSDGPSQIQGEVLGTGAPLPDRRGTVRLKEAYAETIFPLIQDRPFVQSLSLEAGLRNTNFESKGSQSYNTHKFGAEWAPIKGLRFRAMQQKATRAPSINELFAPQVSGLSNLAVDPCQGNRINSGQANTAGTLSNLCRQTGVPVNQIGLLPAPSAGQINNLTGGNPDLGPEVADTTTLGFVWEPAAISGLTFTLDYYKIDLRDAISTASVTDVLNGCYSPTLNPNFEFNSFCAQIFRNPGNGTFNGAEARGVSTARSNLGKIATSGIDVTVAYRLPLRNLGVAPSWGTLDLALSYNQVEDLKFQATPNSINRDCNGYYSVACGNAFGSPNFKRKFTQRTNWNMGNWSVGYAWRHLGKVVEEPIDASFLPAYSTIKAYNYFDLTGSWNATKNLRVNLSVTNLFDKKAPNIGNTIGTTTANSGNTFPQVYDVVGRYYTIGASMRF